MLLSIDQRQRISLSGLSVDDVAPLAAALGAGPLGSDAIERFYDRTGGHTLYLQTVLSDTEGWNGSGEAIAVPASLAAAIGDQLAVLSAPTRSLLEMLAVVNVPMPLAQLGTRQGWRSRARRSSRR